MQFSWKAVLGFGLVVLTAVLLLLHKLFGADELAKAAVKSIEAAHKPRIDELNAHISELSKDEQANVDALSKAKREVEDRKSDLNMVYDHAGLSDDEIVERLSRMSL